MSRLEAWFHHVSNFLVGGTGLIYAWMLFFATSDDEFSVWNHPWQGAAHDLHLVLAPILAVSFGMIWIAHASKRVRSGQKKKRTSGLALCLSFLPMLFSAYFLQVAIDEEWRSIWKWIHLITSLFWLAAYAAHQLSRKIKAKNA